MLIIFKPVYWVLISSLILFSPIISILINKCINESYWLTGPLNFVSIIGFSIYVSHYFYLKLNVYLKNTYIYKLTLDGYYLLNSINNQINNKLLDYINKMIFKGICLMNTKQETSNIKCIKETEYDIELLNLLGNNLKTFKNIKKLLDDNAIIISNERKIDEINNDINNSKKKITKYLCKLSKKSKKNNVKKNPKLDKSQFNDMLDMIKKQE